MVATRKPLAHAPALAACLALSLALPLGGCLSSGESRSAYLYDRD